MFCSQLCRCHCVLTDCLQLNLNFFSVACWVRCSLCRAYSLPWRGTVFCSNLCPKWVNGSRPWLPPWRQVPLRVSSTDRDSPPDLLWACDVVTLLLVVIACNNLWGVPKHVGDKIMCFLGICVSFVLCSLSQSLNLSCRFCEKTNNQSEKESVT